MRLRKAPKAPLAVAAILAMPLFFTGLMVVSLAVEKPTVAHVLRQGKVVAKLGDPSGTTEATIWLLALVAPVAVVLVGAAGTFIGRIGVVSSSLAAIAAAVALLVPLNTWTSRHTGRYPDGIDLIPRSSTSDIYLRGEWEGRARVTAKQLGVTTIVLAGVAIGIFGLLEGRRRRGVRGMLVPPPPAIAEGQSQIVRGGLGRRRFWR
ncbi:MAG: hypothetical protein WAQ33_13985 [Gaiellaceae bacterium]